MFVVACFYFLISTSNIWTFYRLAAVVRCQLSYLVIPWFNFVFVVFVSVHVANWEGASGVEDAE